MTINNNLVRIMQSYNKSEFTKIDFKHYNQKHIERIDYMTIKKNKLNNPLIFSYKYKTFTPKEKNQIFIEKHTQVFIVCIFS